MLKGFYTAWQQNLAQEEQVDFSTEPNYKFRPIENMEPYDEVWHVVVTGEEE